MSIDTSRKNLLHVSAVAGGHTRQGHPELAVEPRHQLRVIQLARHVERQLPDLTDTDRRSLVELIGGAW